MAEWRMCPKCKHIVLRFPCENCGYNEAMDIKTLDHTEEI